MVGTDRAIRNREHRNDIHGGGLRIVFYNLNGVDRTLSDMDGGGTEFADGDNYTVANGSVKGDAIWSGADGSRAAGGDCTVNAGGYYHQENTVKFYFKTGFDFVVNNGSVKILGQSGGGTELGSADTSNRMAQVRMANGSMYVSYCDFGYGMSSILQIATSSVVHFYNCTIKEDTSYGHTFFFYGSAKLTFEDCILHSGGTQYFNTDGTNYGVLYLINTTLADATTYVMAGGLQMLIYFVGTSNWNGDYEPDATWWNGETTTHRPVVFKYNRLTVDESNTVVGATLGNPTHPSQDAEGMFNWESTETKWRVPMVYWGTPTDTDASGESVIYLLQYILIFNSAGAFETKYISDSGQATAGDNQKYTLVMTKSGYCFASTTAWADDGTASITLTAIPIISGQQLDDYSFTTSESTTARMNVTNSPTGCVVWIEGKSIALIESTATAGLWEGTVHGNYVGQVTNAPVLFIAGKDGVGDSALAGSNVTIAMSTVKVNPDPLSTIYNMMDDDWIPASTSDIKPAIKAMVDENELKEYRGTKKFDFKDDTIVMYELNEGEIAVGTGYNNINRDDAVSIDIHVSTTRAHFREVIDMVKYIINKNRKHPATYPVNVDYPYESVYMEGKGQEFSDKYSGHYRFVLTVNFKNFWERIDW